MRVVKLAILSFIFLFLLVTIISLFIPSHVRISKATEINNTKESVMGFVANPLKWREWYPGTDSLSILYIEGKPKGILLDSGGMVGIAIIAANDSMVTASNVGSQVKQPMEMSWKLLPGNSANHVILQWYVDFTLKWYPWEKFKSPFFENMHGVQMEQGLANLKELCEGSRLSN